MNDSSGRGRGVQQGMMATAAQAPRNRNPVTPPGPSGTQSQNGAGGNGRSPVQVPDYSGMSKLAINVMESCPPDMEPASYIYKIKQDTISRFLAAELKRKRVKVKECTSQTK